MSQKQVKGRRKDGKGIDSSDRHGENYGNYCFGMVSRRNGRNVRMKNVMYGCVGKCVKAGSNVVCVK